ncbi:MAG: hypothetical protein Q8K18_02845 [Burkholderiales bacterium]|nr:hypothetical protein [Burkholderiales bacterium]
MTPAEPAADAAWVVIDAPLAPQALAAFCQDLERLYRINPYLEFKTWQSSENGQIHAVYRNLSNQREFDLHIRPERKSGFDFQVRYDHGARRSTRFEVEAAPGGSRLRITDDYTPLTSGAPADPDEADKSLHAWGVALQTYLKREHHWGKSAIWRWYMRRVWVPMKPSARRITFIIVMVTLAEIMLFALVITIYWIEMRR